MSWLPFLCFTIPAAVWGWSRWWFDIRQAKARKVVSRLTALPLHLPGAEYYTLSCCNYPVHFFLPRGTSAKVALICPKCLQPWMLYWDSHGRIRTEQVPPTVHHPAT